MGAPRRSQRAGSAAHKNLAEPDGNDSWDDSDDDVQPKAARAGAKRKALKSAQDGGTGPSPAKQRRIKQAVDLHDLSLLEVIMHHSNAMDTAVKEWIDRYKTNRAAAAAELMTVLVKACGCDEELSENDVTEEEADQLAQRLSHTVQEEGGTNMFPPSRVGRTFAAHYCMFWDKVLRGLAAADLLFDDFELNDKLVHLVTALSLSVVRPFRHAATLTAAQLVSSWIVVSEGLAESRDLAKAQLDAEEKKQQRAKGKSAAGGQHQVVAALRRTLERCHARVEDLKNLRRVTISGVFNHRFRDVSEEIRCIVIEALGDWIRSLPSEFLADSHLKYLAWALSDRAPAVRRQAVEALRQLYANSDNVPRLQEFTARFTSRFCELMHDVDEGVAAAGLRLLALLVGHGAIQHKDVSGVYMLLALPSPELRSSAAELVVELLEDQGRELVEAGAAAAAAKAAADAAADAPVQQPGGSSKAKARGTKSKAAQQAAAAAAGPGAAAGDATAAAAAAILKGSGRLKLAGLIAVMGRLAGATAQAGGGITVGELRSHTLLSQANTQQQQQGGLAAGSSGSSALPTLPQAVVAKLVDALWEHMHKVLSDIRSLTHELEEDASNELWGRVGSAHLASLIAAAAHACIYGGHTATGSRRGRQPRKATAAAAAAAAGADGSSGAAAAVADEDAQQDVTVVMMEKLPALLTKFQAEPAVVAPLLAVPRLLRLELYMLRGAAETYRSLLTQVDGLMQRHRQQELLVEAAGALVFASSTGPEALQEVGAQVLQAASSTATSKLASSAAAVSKLRGHQLAEGVADLNHTPEQAPDALLSLLTGARRVHVLLAAGSSSLARDKQLAKTCQTLLHQVLQGRELGPEITSLLLHITNLSLMWQLSAATTAAAAAAAADPAAISAYLQQRSAFVKVLEGLLDSGATEQLVTPEQLLSSQWWNNTSRQGGNTSSQQQRQRAVPAELAEQLSVGLHTLQDLAFLILTDLLFLENGNVGQLSTAAAAAAAGNGGGRGGSAVGGGFGQMHLSSGVMDRLWRYCCSVFERESPEVGEGVAVGSDPVAGEDGEEEEEFDDLDDWDAEGLAARRAARAAARRDALAAAAAGLSVLQQRVVMALSRLLGYRVLPEPGFSWLLTRIITLLDGYSNQVYSSTRALLLHLKSMSRDNLVAPFIEGLAALFEEAQEVHGDEEGGGAHHRGDRHDKTSWAHVAAVSSKLAGLFQGHNLSQVVLGSLVDAGLSWTLEEPSSRSAFPLTCLGPFLQKLSPAEADRVARGLQGQLAAAAADDDEGGGGEVGAVLEADPGAAAQLHAFLEHLKERAAGKKVTRGVLKTPGKAAAAAADHDDDEDEEEAAGEDAAEADEADGDVAVVAARRGGKSKGKGQKKGSRIRFAADVDEAVAAADDDNTVPAAAPGAAKGRTSRKRQQQPDNEGEAAEAADADGWHSRRQSSSPGSASKQAGAKRQRRQQQQQPASSSAHSEGDAEEEDAIEGPEQEEEQQEEVAGTSSGSHKRQPKAATATTARRAALRQADSDAGPLHSQSQGQSIDNASQGRRPRRPQQQQQQRPAEVAAAADNVDEDGAGGFEEQSQGAGVFGSLMANSVDDDQQQQHSMGEVEDEEDEGDTQLAAEDDVGVPVFFSDEQLPRMGRAKPSVRAQPENATAAVAAAEDDGDEEMEEADHGLEAATSEEEEELVEEEEEEASELLQQTGSLGADQEEDEEEEGLEEGYDVEEGDEDDQQQRFGGVSQMSEPLPSLQVVIDDVPEVEAGEEVDEPPPTKRGRRRR